MQGRGQPELEPGPVILAEVAASPAASACRYRRTASSNASESSAAAAAASHAATARARSPGSDTSTRCRATSARCRRSSPWSQRLDRVRRRGVQPLLLRRAEPGHHRRADQRVREAMIPGPLAGHQESGAPPLIQRAEQAQHRPVQGLATTPAEKLLPATAAACSTARASSDSWASR